MSDIIRVTKDGRTYEIPGTWCAGLAQRAALDGYTITVQDAIAFYIEQAEIDEAR